MYLSGLGGFYEPRIQMEMTWNRVANVNGIPGRNIPLDLLNEFINGDFKGKLRYQEHIYTCI